MSRFQRSLITFLLGCLIFIVVPLVAWGPDDVQGFTGNPARVGYLAVVLLLNAIAAIRVPEVGKGRSLEKSKVRRQHIAVILLQVLSILIVLTGPYCDRLDFATFVDQIVARFVGLGWYAVGFLVMHITEVHLGKQFSVEVAIQEGHRLVTDGPYRYIRHPRYAGIILFSIGISLVFRSEIG